LNVSIGATAISVGPRKPPLAAKLNTELFFSETDFADAIPNLSFFNRPIQVAVVRGVEFDFS
jgi:hypothetical protein